MGIATCEVSISLKLVFVFIDQVIDDGGETDVVFWIPKCFVVNLGLL